MNTVKLINISNLKNLPRVDLSADDVGQDHLDRYYKTGMNFSKDLGLKGKYCYHPFNSVTIDSRGDCYVCVCQAWLPIPVGNILQFNSLQEIVESPKAREIQASIIDGTYKYCDNHTCHLISNGNLENRIDHRPDTVNWIVFALDDSCNLSCPSCRTDLIFHNKGEEFERRMAISDHIVKLIEQHNHFLKFTLSGDGDPFASHIYRNMLEKLDLIDNKNVEIEIVTNGILVKSHWNRMIGIHDNVVRMRISFDAGTPDVYAKTRRGGDWNKLIESCKYIVKWKRKTYSDMELQAAFVVQEANYKEIHTFTRLALDLGFDSILLQKVTDWGKWHIDGVNYFAEHAVWMPDHPHHQELIEILNDSLMFNTQIDLSNLTHLQKKQGHLPLHKLVEFKNILNLQLLDLVNKTAVQNSNFKNSIYSMRPYSDKFDLEYNALTNLSDQINNKVTFMQEAIKTLNFKYNKEINSLTKDFFKQGYIIDGREALVPAQELEERGRILSLLEDTAVAVSSSIQQYVSWQYPGLEIGPGNSQWTSLLVGCDPLYLVDRHKIFLDEAVKQFPEEYQRRLRPYLTEGINLSMLPQNQFGFVLSWNVFNYLTPDKIDLYLAEIFKVLRPGGVAMFSYNNGERVQSAKFAEIGYMSYMPKNHLMLLLQKYGFELLADKEFEETINWVEIRKPGELHTVKSHQALARIVNRT